MSIRRRLKSPTPFAWRIVQMVLAGYATTIGTVIATYEGPAPLWLHFVGATLTIGAALCELATHPDQPTPPAE